MGLHCLMGRGEGEREMGGEGGGHYVCVTV